MPFNVADADLVLLQRYGEYGDAEAFAQIVQRYARVVYCASVRILGDEGGAQDVSQETFFRLMQQPKLVTDSLAGWLHRTATHLALDMRRSEIARKAREKAFTVESENERWIDPVWSEISPVVDQALNEIKEPTRSLLVRHFLQGVPQADLAKEMDVSPATLSRRVKSGLVELQRQLKQKGVYLGLIAIVDFCTNQAADAASPAFISEMGKMQLIASFRTVLPDVTPPRSRPPSPFRLRELSDEYAPSKFVTAFILVTAIVAAYSLALMATWIHGTVIPHTNQTADIQASR